jgi:hypothetical protein
MREGEAHEAHRFGRPIQHWLVHLVDDRAYSGSTHDHRAEAVSDMTEDQKWNFIGRLVHLNSRFGQNPNPPFQLLCQL